MDVLKQSISYRNRLHVESPKITCKKHVKRVITSQTVKDESTGRLVQNTQYVEVDNNNYLNRFRVNDFSIEVMQNVGAMDGAQNITLRHDSQTELASIEHALSSSSIYNSNNN